MSPYQIVVNTDLLKWQMSSYMHFHSLDCSLSPIRIIVVVILVYVCSVYLWPIRRRLLAIIESFQHSGVGTRFRQQEVVLKNSIVLRLLSLLLIAEFSRPIILQVLHETSLSFVHNIIVMRCPLLRRVVESRSGRICARTET